MFYLPVGPVGGGTSVTSSVPTFNWNKLCVQHHSYSAGPPKYKKRFGLVWFVKNTSLTPPQFLRVSCFTYEDVNSLIVNTLFESKSVHLMHH